MKTFLAGKSNPKSILARVAPILLFVIFLFSGALTLVAGDSTTLGAAGLGGTLAGKTSKNISEGSNYAYWPTPGTYSWTIPDDAASKVWVTLAAGGSGGLGPCTDFGEPGYGGNWGYGGNAGGFVNRQQVSVVPGTAATIVVGSGGPASGNIGTTYAQENNSGSTVGGNTCFYHSGGTVCATGGYWYWDQPWCRESGGAGGPSAGGGAGGAVNGNGSGGYARIDW